MEPTGFLSTSVLRQVIGSAAGSEHLYLGQLSPASSIASVAGDEDQRSQASSHLYIDGQALLPTLLPQPSSLSKSTSASVPSPPNEASDGTEHSHGASPDKLEILTRRLEMLERIQLRLLLPVDSSSQRYRKTCRNVGRYRSQSPVSSESSCGSSELGDTEVTVPKNKSSAAQRRHRKRKWKRRPTTQVTRGDELVNKGPVYASLEAVSDGDQDGEINSGRLKQSEPMLNREGMDPLERDARPQVAACEESTEENEEEVVEEVAEEEVVQEEGMMQVAEEEVVVAELSSTTKEQQASCPEGDTMQISKAEQEQVVELRMLREEVRMLRAQLEQAGAEPVAWVDYDHAELELKHALEDLWHERKPAKEAEAEVARWESVIQLHPEFARRQEDQRQQWIKDNKELCQQALVELRSLIPADIFTSTLTSLVSRGLPRPLAQRLRSKRVLWLLRMHELDIQRLHTADLVTKFTSHGLDLRELRAVWSVLPTAFESDPRGEKSKWKQELFDKLVDLSEQLCRAPNLQDRRRMEQPHQVYRDVIGLKLFDPNEPLHRHDAVTSNAFSTEVEDVRALRASGPKEFTNDAFLRERLAKDKAIKAAAAAAAAATAAAVATTTSAPSGSASTTAPAPVPAPVIVRPTGQRMPRPRYSGFLVELRQKLGIDPVATSTSASPIEPRPSSHSSRSSRRRKRTSAATDASDAPSTVVAQSTGTVGFGGQSVVFPGEQMPVCNWWRKEREAEEAQAIEDAEWWKRRSIASATGTHGFDRESFPTERVPVTPYFMTTAAISVPVVTGEPAIAPVRATRRHHRRHRRQGRRSQPSPPEGMNAHSTNECAPRPRGEGNSTQVQELSSPILGQDAVRDYQGHSSSSSEAEGWSSSAPPTPSLDRAPTVLSPGLSLAASFSDLDIDALTSSERYEDGDDDSVSGNTSEAAACLITESPNFADARAIVAPLLTKSLHTKFPRHLQRQEILERIRKEKNKATEREDSSALEGPRQHLDSQLPSNPDVAQALASIRYAAMFAAVTWSWSNKHFQPTTPAGKLERVGEKEIVLGGRRNHLPARLPSAKQHAHSRPASVHGMVKNLVQSLFPIPSCATYSGPQETVTQLAAPPKPDQQSLLRRGGQSPWSWFSGASALKVSFTLELV